MRLARLFTRKDRHARAAADLYLAVVGQARAPAFYARLAVPDTLDGRFELIALHAFLVLHRLADAPGRTRELGQALFDLLFADMDRNLREMGAGDLGVGKRVQRMAEAFYGRIAAYREGLAGDDAALRAAVRRNLYGTVIDRPAPAAAMAAYMRAATTLLAAQDLAALESGRVRFPAPPDPPD
ncbi:MAG: ubiquinol-cytochrome C chaperone family protein [Alphaproteobacteria bacterium]|nr:ubiquinol-cytochrome C chaperone family protein [Alphaproteobacteria bacterium]